MPSLRDYRLFISHAWQYTDGYNRLETLLNAAANFSWLNYSVPRADSVSAQTTTGLEEAMRRQIRPVQAVLIIASMYVNHSRWIQFEMDFAKELRKPIVGVVPYGGERTPQAVANAADEMVAWSTVSIVDAVRRLSI